MQSAGHPDRMDDPLDDSEILAKKKKKKKKKRLWRIFQCCCCKDPDEEPEALPEKSRTELFRIFKEQMTFEIWIIFIIKLVTSVIFLIDDLTFLLFCQYEFGMSPSEAGILFCISACCLFVYGLTISGYIIDKTGVKISLLIGLIVYAIAKFVLIFTESRAHLYFIMVTFGPFGISIIFPASILGVKKLTRENARPMAFSFFFGAMVIGAIFSGPIVDWIRHDYKTTTWPYDHFN